MAAVGELPLGVGRVPKWWMEITPHYTLDEEDAEARRLAEDQMDYYYMQLAAADEAGLLNSDGTPKDGVDMASWTPSNPWNGRSVGGNNGSSAQTPGGRSFHHGQAVIDPKIFGIYLNDPDYKAYLTGAKLPPGYFEKMGEFARCKEGGAQGILNNLKQTDYGRYGRQAEAPSFKPAWTKKKLRSTSTGTNIRQGQYDDSPNKHINKRRVQPQVIAPSLDEGPDSQPPATIQSVAALEIQQEPDPAHEQPEPEPLHAKPEPEIVDEPATMVRTVRTVVRTDEQVEEDAPAPKAPTLSEYMHKAPPVDPNVERKLQEQKEKLARLKELQRQQQLLKEQREEEDRQNNAAAQEDEESYEEEIIEEEVVEEYSDGSYEEEIIEDEAAPVPEQNAEDEDELNNLQAILAAKQAELQRLKAQM